MFVAGTRDAFRAAEKRTIFQLAEVSGAEGSDLRVLLEQAGLVDVADLVFILVLCYSL